MSDIISSRLSEMKKRWKKHSNPLPTPLSDSLLLLVRMHLSEWSRASLSNFFSMKWLFSCILLCISSIFFVSNIFAAPIGCNIEKINAGTFLKNCGAGTAWIQPGGGDGKSGVKERVKTIAETAIAFGALLAVAMLVWSGIQYTITYGEDEKIKHAKTTAVYALIGLILMMASFWLVDVFLSFIFTAWSWGK